MFATGYVAAAVQILFLREYLSIFSGNELVIGLIFGLWLLSAAAGSRIGSRDDFASAGRFAFLYVLSIIAGFLLLRAVRLFYHPGEIIPPWHIPFIILLTQSAAALSGGLVFGRLSRIVDGVKLYFAESAGAAAGFIGVSLCSIRRLPNGDILAGTLVLLATAAYGLKPFASLRDRRWLTGYFIASLVAIAGLAGMDSLSVRWKYALTVESIVNGYEGEIALSRETGGPITLLNNTVYRADMPLPSIEQAVHVPASMHMGLPHHALVIGNPGFLRELQKYGNMRVTCLETEPSLAKNGCTCGAIETFKPHGTFDLILLGAGMPMTAGTSRFYTTSFFRKMRQMAGDSGIFSFTLPFSENFLSPQEQRLKDLLQVTLCREFRHCSIMPGEGYTFMASNQPLPWPAAPSVPTEYLASYTLASLTPERMEKAQEVIDSVSFNTINKPVILLEAQRQWLHLFGMPLVFPAGVLFIFLIGALIVSPRTREALSVGTSGFTAGAYSIALLLVYQCTYGVLYSKISVLMVALAIGFMLGSRMKKIPFSDLVIGCYAAVTLCMLVWIVSPPLPLFLIFHSGMGFLAGAQFVTRRAPSWGGLYAADLAGGVFGMALASTVFVPWFGMMSLAALLGIIKLIAAAIQLRR
jgi:spermidine synthase